MAADNDQAENVRTIVATSRREQGLPPKVEDVTVLHRVAVMLDGQERREPAA